MRKILLVILLAYSLLTFAQGNKHYKAYIKHYAPMAVEQMKKYDIPASITLAQGLLESGAGRSHLARKSHNHFGIKCGGAWRGKKVYHDDDRRGECFRKYKHARDSYEDHSLFLKRGRRYSKLFELKITDYKGWAKGLKKAGYATDRKYAYRLIDIIEKYELYRYDRFYNTKKKVKDAPWLLNPHTPRICNGILYVIAREGDTWEMISKEFDVSKRKLRSYNEVDKKYKLKKGDIVFLKKKKKKAAKGLSKHTVKNGESMYSIAQHYGIRVKYLYKKNHYKENYVPHVGDVLIIR